MLYTKLSQKMNQLLIKARRHYDELPETMLAQITILLKTVRSIDKSDQTAIHDAAGTIDNLTNEINHIIYPDTEKRPAETLRQTVLQTEKGALKTTHFLSYQDRPAPLVHAVDNAFDTLKALKKSTWTHNGEKNSYQLFNKNNEYQFIKQLILNNPTQKAFLLLDLGAGQFGFSQYICEQLEIDASIPKDIQINFVSVRGESSDEPYQVIQGNKCTQYNLSAFPVENLKDAFQTIRDAHPEFPELDGQADAVISCMTFTHLIDPLGTLVQAYDLLKPTTGYLLFDGFECALINDHHTTDTQEDFFDGFNVHHNLYLALIMSGASVLINPSAQNQGLHQFILKRKDEQSLAIPLQYYTDILDSKLNSYPHEMATYQPQHDHWLAFLGSYFTCVQDDKRVFIGDENLLQESKTYFRKEKSTICLAFDDCFDLTTATYPVKKVQQQSINITADFIKALPPLLQQPITMATAFGVVTTCALEALTELLHPATVMTGLAVGFATYGVFNELSSQIDASQKSEHAPAL